MSDNRKYYYLKLNENFFESDYVLYLENIPDGYIYINILLKLYLKSLKDNGRLAFKERIPYTKEMLASIVRHSVETVENALEIFESIGLIEVLDNGFIYITDMQNLIGSSSDEADRKRAYRQRINEDKRKQSTVKETGQTSGQTSDQTSGQTSAQTSGQTSDQTSGQTSTQIELDINIKIDRENVSPAGKACIPDPPVQTVKKDKAQEAEELFECLWKEYPSKKGKASVSKKQKLRLLEIGEPALMKAIDRYKEELEKNSWRTPKDGSTFFNRGYVDYLDENYEPYTPRADPGKNRFNNFHQRDNDYDKLQKQLVQNGLK